MITSHPEEVTFYTLILSSNFHSIFHLCTQLAFIFGPIPAYLPQYLTLLRTNSKYKQDENTSTNDDCHMRFQISKNNPSSKTISSTNSTNSSSSGFSPLSSLILLTAHSLRLIYFQQQFFQKWDLFLQSIVMIVLQLCFLKLNHRQFLKKSTNATSSSRDWIEFTILFITGLFFILRLVNWGIFSIEWIGMTSVILESTLALPQIYQNCSLKSTNGLSWIMVLGWAVGDFMKLVYFMVQSQAVVVSDDDKANSLGLFQWGCLLALILDGIVMVQIVYFYPSSEIVAMKEYIRRRVMMIVWRRKEDDEMLGCSKLKGTMFDLIFVLFSREKTLLPHGKHLHGDSHVSSD